MISSRSSSPKLCTLEQVLLHRQRAKEHGDRVVHCHGCFDIVHPGHVRHLEHARTLGERLLVTLTADEFIDKGIARPLFEQSLRAENLAALECVDWVLINPAPTAADLLKAIKPDVYVKGAEYEENDDPRFAAERDAVECAGGRVVFTSGDIVFSSTALIESMRHGIDSDDPFAVDSHTIALNRLHRAHDLSPANIHRTLDAMRGRRIVIVGESIIDTYVNCAWPEVTGEAPILSLRPRERVSFDGGAAVIARHAAAVGAHPVLVTPVPRTVEGQALRERLEHAGITVESITTETPVPMKERFLVGREKLVKLDHTAPIELDRQTCEHVIAAVAHHADGADAAIVADFGNGMLGPRLAADVFSTLRPHVSVLSGDVSGPRPSLQHMLDADLLTPSERELRGSVTTATGSLPAVATELMQKTNAKHIAVTLADEGMVVFEHREETDAPDGQPARLSSMHIPALNAAPMDTLGCGDALLTLSTLAIATGAGVGISSYIGSLAAAVCGSKLGNHTCQPTDILRVAQRLHNGCQAQSTQHTHTMDTA